MKIKYRTVTEDIEIEVEEEWADIIRNEERHDDNLNRKERSHCWHKDMFEDKEDWIADHTYDPFYNLCRETWEEKMNRLYYAISQLTEDQQRLIDYVYFQGYSLKAFAAIEGVSPMAISKRHKTIIKKLREIF